MKNIFTIAFLTISVLITNAQLYNSSFENWQSPQLHNTDTVEGNIIGQSYRICVDFDYDELEHWSSTNQITGDPSLGSKEFVYDTTLATDGTKGLVIKSKEVDLVAQIGPFPLSYCSGITTYSLQNVNPSLIVNGNFKIDLQEVINSLIGGGGLDALNPFTYPGTGDAINFIPDTLFGKFQYTGGVDGSDVDSCIIVSGLVKNGVIIGHVLQRFGTTSGGWNEFALPYEHLNCEIPDTIITMITSSNLNINFVGNQFVIAGNSTGIDGSLLIIDELSLDTILPSEFPPILLDDNISISATDIATVSILNNDFFCDGITLTPILFYSGTEGTAIINGSNELVFTPNTGYSGIVNIQYYTCNIASVCDTATVTINVDAIPICYANNDIKAVTGSNSITFDPRLNDVECGITISIVQNPSNGSAVLESNNNITYSPNGSFSGVDTLTYRTCSPNAPTQCDTAKVSFNVVSGIINTINAELIEFYPNPANNNLIIKVNLSNEIKVSIYNTLGEKIISTSFYNEKTILLDALSNGIYFVEIETDNKKSIKKLQVIK